MQKIGQLLTLADALAGKTSPGMSADSDDELTQLNEMIRNIGIGAPAEIKRIIEDQ